MFYQPSSSRVLLRAWVQDILDGITFASTDRLSLDEIIASEVLDLAYLEGSDLSTAIGAHALFPYEVEQEESYRGYGVTSSMKIVFPLNVESENWGYDVMLRAGLPSMLTVGQGPYFPRQEPSMALPEALIVPTIGNTRFVIREANGNRLQVLAGPLQPFEEHLSQTVTQAFGKQEKPISRPASWRTYAYQDEQGILHIQPGSDGLQPLINIPQSMPSLYLQSRSLSFSLTLHVSWQRIRPDRVQLTVTVQNQTKLKQVQGSRSEARNALLSALVLPHLKIVLHGATADFPQQQYTQGKRKMLRLPDEDQRREEAERRLYQVLQSGCIATINPHDDSCVLMTTFGVFDTPREQPVQGPSVEQVTQSPEKLLQEYPNHDNQVTQFVQKYWTLIRGILSAAGQAFRLTHFHQFQWDAITAGLTFEATGQGRTATIVRAPTGAGKTVVFMVNAAISSLCGKQRSASVLLFPTRILNEDMFRRLTMFVYCLRQNVPDCGVTGGILMGTSDPLYKLMLNPEEGERMHHYGVCPSCQAPSLVAQHGRDPSETKLFPTCPVCGHRVDYMYHPREVTAYLPDIVIATPDKLFYEATVEGNEMYCYGSFGAPVRYCQQCGRAHPDAYFKLKPEKTRCSQVFSDSHCTGTFSALAVSKPIRYMGFDEVHSLYGETATYLSVFLATLESMQRLLSKQRDLTIRYETATATIANETQLLEAITRRRGEEIISIPRDDQLADYFLIQEDRIRHRTLVTMPSRESSKDIFIRAVLNSFGHLRSTMPDFVADLAEYLQTISEQPHAWDFLLGYVFKKQDGYDLRRALGDYFRNRFGSSLKIEFLSGDAPKDQISRVLLEALSGQLAVLLANMVISLGIDLQDLNHMIMFGVPRSFTEYVQTTGRTGRGNVSGHVSVILLPSYPRDVYLYRHFHAILSDVAGYYDVLPVKSTNLYCSEQIFGNVSKALLSTLCLSVDPPDWPHRNGVQRAVGGREPQILGYIVSLLCDDTTLRHDTARIVAAKYRRLLDEIQSNSKFLAKLMKESENTWLMYSLRGRTGDSVRISCRDQNLLELMGMIPLATVVQEEESEVTDAD